MLYLYQYGLIAQFDCLFFTLLKMYLSFNCYVYRRFINVQIWITFIPLIRHYLISKGTNFNFNQRAKFHRYEMSLKEIYFFCWFHDRRFYIVAFSTEPWAAYLIASKLILYIFYENFESRPSLIQHITGVQIFLFNFQWEIELRKASIIKHYYSILPYLLYSESISFYNSEWIKW